MNDREIIVNVMLKPQFVSKKPIPILFEDDNFIVFDKPANMLVIPSPKGEENTLTHIVNEQYKHKDYHLHPCHRLDRETSGVILYAKGKANQKLMMDCFKEQQISKTYIALVHGKLPKKEGLFNKPIKGFEARKFNQRAKPKSAETKYKVCEQYALFSVVEVNPVTGRTNQIRIHFSDAGHPLVGETKYAFRKDFSLRFKRTALHAHQISFVSPKTNRQVKVESDLPKDMQEFINKNK